MWANSLTINMYLKRLKYSKEILRAYSCNTLDDGAISLK